MSIEFVAPEIDELRPRISVIGVGGAGGNAIANMIANNVQGVDFIVANTDAQALNTATADRRIQLGLKITQGLGAGSRPEIGRAAAEEAHDLVEKALDGAHMCFIAAGMGGGTGTGAAPVIAKAARDKGILTVGVVTKPFSFEGSRRMKSAEAGIAELQKHVDTLIVIPNQNLFLIANPSTTFKEAFEMADEVLQQGVRGITDLMIMPGLINLDFADVRSVMGEMGKAMMGTGEADGENRAIEAAEKAIANPLLDGVSMRGAKGVIVSIIGGEDMRLMEVDEAASHIKELVDPDANIIWGSAFNPELEGKIRVSVVATGIDAEAAVAPEPARVFSFPAAKKPVEVEAEAPAPVEEVAAAPDPVVDVAPPAPVAAPKPAIFEAIPAKHVAPAEAAAPAPAPAPMRTFSDNAAPGFSSIPVSLTPPAPVAPAPTAGEELLLTPAAAIEGPVETIPALHKASEAPKAPEADSPLRARVFSDDAPAPTAVEPVAVEDKPAPRIAPAAAGTLFERMSNVARTMARGTEPADGKDPLDIPRFLNRQNNQ